MKAEKVVYAILGMDRRGQLMKDQLRRFRERIAIVEQNAQYLRNYLQHGLESTGKKRLETPAFSMSLRKSTAVIITSDNPRYESVNSIINDVLSGLEEPNRARVEPDRTAAITCAISNSGPGDIVLVAGKGHETWQEVAGQQLPFSDESVIRAAPEAAP